MQKIFVGNKPIVLTTKVEPESDFKNYLIDTVDINKVLHNLKKEKYKSIRLIDDNEEVLLKKFLRLLPNIVAGGGKVVNSDGKILFIFRNGKWDLPKGKAERNETIEETSIREVTEETGVNGLKNTKPLDITYHIFKRNGRYKIKVTHWFEMKTSFDGNLHAQEDEGITKVAWLNDKEANKALENSYANIKLLV